LFSTFPVLSLFPIKENAVMAGKGSLTRRVPLLFSEEDYQRLQARFAASTSPVFSAFCRDILLSRPVILRYHNMDADEFLVIVLELKRELEDEIRYHRRSSPELQLAVLIAKVDELKLIMHQIYQRWSPD
jgi:hypothetical protein